MANKITGSGTKQVSLKDLSEIEQKQIIDMTSRMTKIAIQNRKVMAVMLTFDVKGKCQIIHFGAAPEIKKRAKFFADKIGDAVPALITAYDLPQPEVPGDEKIEA